MKLAIAPPVVLLLSAAAVAQDFQVGARPKGMGGSYTAFEDDPTSIWLNPAGIATQSDQASIQYQSYTQYEPGDAAFTQAAGPGQAEVGYIDPPLLPSYLGMVFQLGTDEQPHAIGIAYARPVHMKLTYDTKASVNDTELLAEQQFSRFRISYGRGFRLKDLGEAGMLPQVAAGVGIDLGYTKYEEVSPPAGGLSTNDTASRIGFGLGVLATLYDDTETFKVNIGAAFQSELDFEFQASEQLTPLWDWPQMINAGLTFYMLQDQPLRMTIDVQLISWEDAILEPNPTLQAAGKESFRDSTNFSVGFEYKLEVGEKLWMLPRAGFRKLQAPWEDKENLPATGSENLLISTDDSEFNMGTLGLGVRWQSAEGKSRGIDVGMDFGADIYNVAFGYVHEF